VGKYIFFEIFKQIFQNCISNKKLILIDAPTLYETKILTHICYPILVVGCPENIQIERLMRNRNLSEEDAKIRIKCQMPLSLKQKLADIYI
jgi:dephospho-CoA kinase